MIIEFEVIDSWVMDRYCGFVNVVVFNDFKKVFVK